jgi:hypothetical protein
LIVCKGNIISGKRVRLRVFNSVTIGEHQLKPVLIQDLRHTINYAVILSPKPEKRISNAWKMIKNDNNKPEVDQTRQDTLMDLHEELIQQLYSVNATILLLLL